MAARRPPKLRNTPVHSRRPLKIVGQLVGGHFDKDGQLVGEFVAGEIAIYAAQFKQVDKDVREAWPGLLAQIDKPEQ